jgi:homoserine dehydrogenase
MLQIAVLGHGVVGLGVVEVFFKNRESIMKKANCDMDIKYILDLREFPDSPVADRFTKDFNVIINDPEIKVVVEVMGGLNPAYDFVKRCLLCGKSVVTSNKELVATYGFELLSIAREKNVSFLFEASVGGGIPIIRPLHQCLAANEIKEIAGILNGTTNFILTKMIKEKMDFDAALALAQSLGYAERNPAADVEGLDACRKICILASLAFGKHVYPDEVHTEGITKISLKDIEYITNWGGVIKLIARAKKLDDGKIFVCVTPAILKNDSQIARVDDVFNGILVRGDAIGDVIFYGKGAGKLPTASAVVADVIDAVKHISSYKYLFWNEGEKGYVVDFLEQSDKMYFRVSAAHHQSAIKRINQIFGVVMVINFTQDNNEIAFITKSIKYSEAKQAIGCLEEDGISVLSQIPVLDY